MKNRFRALKLLQTLLLAPGYGLSLVGALFVLVSLIQAFQPKEQNGDPEWTWILVSGLLFLIPGLLALRSKKRIDHRVRALEGLQAAINLQSTLPISQLSKQLDLDEVATRNLLLEAASQGWITGQLDHSSNIFYPNRTAEDFSIHELTCDSCKAEVAVRVAPDSVPNCPFCGSSLARELKTQT